MSFEWLIIECNLRFWILGSKSSFLFFCAGPGQLCSEYLYLKYLVKKYRGYGCKESETAVRNYQKIQWAMYMIFGQILGENCKIWLKIGEI